MGGRVEGGVLYEWEGGRLGSEGWARLGGLGRIVLGSQDSSDDEMILGCVPGREA